MKNFLPLNLRLALISVSAALLAFNLQRLFLGIADPTNVFFTCYDTALLVYFWRGLEWK